MKWILLYITFCVACYVICHEITHSWHLSDWSTPLAFIFCLAVFGTGVLMFLTWATDQFNNNDEDQ